LGIELLTIDERRLTDLETLKAMMDERSAPWCCRIPISCNTLERRSANAIPIQDLFIVTADPISLAILKAPRLMERQCVAKVSPGKQHVYGRSAVLAISDQEDLARQMQAACGRNSDIEAKEPMRSLCKPANTIRREKATSNIGSNQSLCTPAHSL
jgi:glycine cleavage system pyridoxal-binding protein P